MPALSWPTSRPSRAIGFEALRGNRRANIQSASISKGGLCFAAESAKVHATSRSWIIIEWEQDMPRPRNSFPVRFSADELNELESRRPSCRVRSRLAAESAFADHCRKRANYAILLSVSGTGFRTSPQFWLNLQVGPTDLFGIAGNEVGERSRHLTKPMKNVAPAHKARV